MAYERLQGNEILFAFAQGVAASWGTAQACGAGDGFRGFPADMDPTAENKADELLGTYFQTDNVPGRVTLNPNPSTYLSYRNAAVLRMLANFMGTQTEPALHAGGAASYDTILKVNQVIDGLFGTLCARTTPTGTILEIPSWKPTRISLKWDTGTACRITFSGPGYDLVLDSVINTPVTFADVTVSELKKRVYAAQTVLRINTQSGAGLGSGDVVPWSSIELVAERKMSSNPEGHNTGGEEARDLTGEPYNDGDWTSSLNVSCSKADLAGWSTIRANTSLKADIVCTGPIIEGAIPYLFTVQMPHLKQNENKTPQKRGALITTKSFSVLGATAAPTGMTGNTDPLWILITNTIATSLLPAP
jgi:hypothetical protein